MRQIDEIVLIEKCIHKDPLAWDEFVSRYSALIYWAIKDRLHKWDYFHQQEDVDEIHQNVFLGIWKNNKLSQIRDHKKIARWLVIVAGNETVDYFKYTKAQTPPLAVSIFKEITDKGAPLTIADTLSSRFNDPFSENSLKEIEIILEQMINTLPAKDKIILNLHFLYNKKYREIGEILNIPTGTVSTTLKAIRAKLKDTLQEKNILF